ncbi:hypothetical protein ABE82_26070 (plasmid) [Paenibacillus peoriae]|uniref:hypothetical protein n=1 Tax=Paenibacillus peoriae TaxID=59893 RepID=UPI00072101B5|nr:hypothetical protein [Paenibacillus peoriae]ALS09888.1 hypothetical protein ABE82_26070 [Paenibacillus peoriae]
MYTSVKECMEFLKKICQEIDIPLLKGTENSIQNSLFMDEVNEISLRSLLITLQKSNMPLFIEIEEITAQEVQNYTLDLEDIQDIAHNYESYSFYSNLMKKVTEQVNVHNEVVNTFKIGSQIKLIGYANLNGTIIIFEVEDGEYNKWDEVSQNSTLFIFEDELENFKELAKEEIESSIVAIRDKVFEQWRNYLLGDLEFALCTNKDLRKKYTMNKMDNVLNRLTETELEIFKTRIGHHELFTVTDLVWNEKKAKGR